MKFLPVTLWMVLFPVAFYLSNLLSVYAGSINGIKYHPVDNDAGVAVMFVLIWFGVGAALYYGVAKL